MKTLAGGWEMAGTIQAQSGAPNNVPGIGVSLNYDPIGLGGGYTNRPNQTVKTHYLKKRGQWFDTSAFSAPVPAWLGGPNLGFGNARKDSVVGPGRVNFTTSLYKSFAIREAASFELRFESFNTFNHVNPQGINVNNHDGNFGKVTSDYGPRTLQLGGKFVF